MAESMDTFELAKMYKYLRVCDVEDALDCVGRPNITLVDSAIRPLFLGTKFWGPAVTLRALPSNHPMRVLPRDQAQLAQKLWYEEVPSKSRELNQHVKPGCVVVMDAHGCGEVGLWGSNNSLGVIALGAIGIVTDGYARDTAELAITKTPIVARARGRTYRPGRAFISDVQVPISCGGALVRPGDIVGCDDDGVVIVPSEVAEEVGKIACDTLLGDETSRRRHYERLNQPADASVDIEMLEAFYKPWR